MDEPRVEFIAGLRALAEFYESQQDAPLPDNQTLRIFKADPGEYRDAVRALGGRREKFQNDTWAGVVRSFGPVGVEIYTFRNTVCTRVQVGTVKEMRPDPDAPQVEVEVPVFAYDCPPVLDDEREAVSS